MKIKMKVLVALNENECLIHPSYLQGVVIMTENMFRYSRQCMAMCNGCIKCRKVKEIVSKFDLDK